MRRQQPPPPLEITSKAPTVGLITRVPSNQPDVRAAVVASNVRFDDGVARAGPGYSTVPVQLAGDSSATDLGSVVNMIFHSTIDRNGVIATYGFIATANKIYLVGAL